MPEIAQTNLQLYGSLIRAQREQGDIEQVHHAYELAARLYSGYYQADGKPFVAHCVGVASVLAELGLPASIIAAGMLHNVYTNGDFGDGRHHTATGARRGLVRDAVGLEVETLVHRFFMDFRIASAGLRQYAGLQEESEAPGRDLVLIELADCLEKYTDLGVLYYSESDWVTADVAETGVLRIELARRLGYPKLAEMLDAAFSAAAETLVPATLRPSDGRRYLRLIVPLSCSPRLSALWRRWLFDGIWKARLGLYAALVRGRKRISPGLDQVKKAP